MVYKRKLRCLLGQTDTSGFVLLSEKIELPTDSSRLVVVVALQWLIHGEMCIMLLNTNYVPWCKHPN